MASVRAASRLALFSGFCWFMMFAILRLNRSMVVVRNVLLSSSIKCSYRVLFVVWCAEMAVDNFPSRLKSGLVI